MKRPFVMTLMVLAMVGCSSDSKSTPDPSCKERGCGDVCDLCPLGDAACSDSKYCQPDGSCRVGMPECGYESCFGKACGDSCTICAPNDTDCAETGEEKYCQVDGSCNAKTPICEYDPCKDKACGDSCTECPPGDSNCTETPGEKFCQTYGDCGPDKPNCETACGGPIRVTEFEECTSAEDGRACTEMGGEWASPPSGDRNFCICPTGEENCSCTNNDDCLGACVAPMSGMDFDSCKDVTEGTCTHSWPVGGCRCWFDREGVATGACAD